MNQNEFKCQIARLQSVYGARNYDVERVKIFYKKYKHLDNLTFTTLVDTLIANEKFTPLEADFEKYLAKSPGLSTQENRQGKQEAQIRLVPPKSMYKGQEDKYQAAIAGLDKFYKKA